MNKSYLYILTSALLLTSCGGGGGGGSTPTPPTVNLSADPTSVLVESTSTLTWSSTNATSCSASWTSQTGTSGSEAVTISAAGNNSFSISCTGADGSGSASVTVEGYRETDGVVVDGYISGAEVCIDEDESWTCDASENSTTSDNEGKFTIRYANGNLVSIGGTDLDSQTLLDNLLITHKLTGHSDFKAITPVTSIAAFMEDASLVNSALGIDASIDVFTFDPVANKGDSGINDYLYEKGNQLTILAFALQNITNNLNTTTETTQDYFKAITEEIEKEYTQTETKVDIETEAFVTKAFENIIAAKSVTIDETAKANTSKALASVLPVIEVKSSDDLTTGVIRFAVSTLQTDIQAIANGTATAETVTSYTNDVLAYIADDQSIDADELAPDISAIADSASTDEDKALEINVLLNDSYLTSSPISVTAGNGTNGTTSVASNIVTYVPDADYNGTDTFSYTITQGDKTSSAEVTVTIFAVADAPSIDIASTIQVAENQTAVTTVSVSDVDEDTITFSIGGTDADSFDWTISASEVENVGYKFDAFIEFKEAPDYETKTSYSITLSLTDGNETVTKDVTIAITNVNDVAPVFTSDAAFSAAENQTAIGTVTATDAEGDDVTFTVSGSELAITSAGVLTFVTAPDYETKNFYTATVTVSDGTNSTTQNITVNVTDVVEAAPNAAPTISSSATFSAAENQTAIGSVTATDADGDSLTYSISGSEINISSSGVLTFASAPDYETQNSYTATVTVSDGTASVSQSVTVTVTDVNEAPTITSSSTFTIAENQTSIGSVTATDPENQTLTYAIYSLPAPLAGEQYSGGSINSSTGAITLGGTGFNYEERTSITAQVEVSDGTNAVTQDITINITDLPQSTVTQLGSTLTHSASFTFEALALSGNGLTLVHGKNTNGVGGGSVEILKFHLGSWTQLGSSIEAEAGETGFGNSVAISNDGTIVAIGITKEEGGGIVRVYKYSSDSWSQLGSDIISADTAAGDYFGYATSLSNDGTILAVGATDMGSDNNGPGAASVYQYSSGSWTQLGSTINGIDANDWFGRSVSLSGNGQIVAIGSDRHDSSKGQVRIYEYVSGSWSQLGSDIDGNSGDRLGRAVSLSDDGSIIALGSNFEGTTKVFQFASGSWSQLGGNMTSSNVNFVTSATISDDGTIVTFGGPGNSVDNPGSFATYKYSSNTWTNIVSVTSTNAQDQFGWATSTSNDGSIVAIGDHNVNGASSNSLAKIVKIEIEN
ncbi:MAG: Ig-like domain-containing protein [Proteobacteria bacterium]|nr:Ig-like domain-containing protein [Pseudomonadota bacterium]